MKRNRLFLVMATVVALGCTTACTQGDDTAAADGAHGQPISFNVGIGSLPNPDVTTRSHDTSGGNVSAPTRGYTTGAANNSGYTFSGGEYMTVAVTGKGITSRPTSEVVKQYTVASGSSGNNSLAYQKDADGSSATIGFNWLSTVESVSIRAWSDGKTKTPATPVVDPVNNTFTIETTQSGDVKELLYSKTADYNYGTNGSISIPLYHQLARIVINLKDDAEGTPTINAITIGHDSDGNRVPTTAKFTVPQSTDYGSWSNQGDLSTIIPKKEATATTGYAHTYTAIVIPSATGSTSEYPSGMKLINVTLPSKNSNSVNVDYSYKLTSAIEIKPGRQYTFNITIKETGLTGATATVSVWGDGTEASSSPITATI